MRYENPILRGFNPDPSICRVGNDYYLVTSSFEYFPGIPVYHSTDLVNWRQIGNCIDRDDQLPYETAAAGQGMWAPTIRYHDGVFFVTATFQGFGNFIIHSANPATGWSDPVKVDMSGIDPSLLFDEGKVYYCTNQRGEDDLEALSLAEIDPFTGALLSPARVIWHGMSGDRPQYLEAPHVYHIGEWYYLLAAEGGTRFNHMITAGRSRSVWGPYVSCDHLILTNRYAENTGVAGSGHGDLAEDQNGNWWLVHLATRPDEGWYSHLGRETFLLPVAWENEWPVIGDGVSHLACEGPLWAQQKPMDSWQADFSFRQPQWLFLRKPRWENYDFQGDKLLLTPSQDHLSDPLGRPTFLALRQMDMDCTAEAEIDFDPIYDGSEAGLTIFVADYGYYTFCKRRENGKNWLSVQRQGGTFHPISIPTEDGSVCLKITASKKEYLFSFAFNKEPFHTWTIVLPLTKDDAGKGFTGTLIGLYAQCGHSNEKKARILSYRQKLASISR